MWNSDIYLVWQHILQHYNKDFDRPLKLLPKLTDQDMHLTSYSKITVKFAVPVLTETTANILQIFSAT